MVSNADYILTPDAVCIPLNIDFILKEPFESELYYKFVFGCGEARPKRFEIRVTPDEITKAINNFLDNPLTSDTKCQVVSDVLKIEEKHQKEIYLKQYYESL